MSTQGATKRPKPLVLCILDGFGEREETEGNAVRLAKSPTLTRLQASAKRTLIGTSGLDVGLPDGQMGNSEVGHLNFGAGRIAQMDITRIDSVVAEDSLGDNAVIDRMLRTVEYRKGTPDCPLHQEFTEKCSLHLMGLVSDGGVHSSLEHLFALIDLAAWREVPVIVHAFLDGRDTPPKSAWTYIEKLLAHLEGKGKIGTIGGRYFAMDRDKRWDRVFKAYTAMVKGKAPVVETAYEAIQQAYDRNITDEFIEPVRIGGYPGVYGDVMSDFAAKDKSWKWIGQEVGLAFNFRPDRMRQLSAMLLNKNLPEEAEELLYERDKRVFAFEEDCFAGMTEYDSSLGMHTAFTKDVVDETFGEVIAKHGLRQLRCAETEKYAHVTYFFSGGREDLFEGEERQLVASPRDVDTYDEKPEMSAAGVAAEVVKSIRAGSHDFILVNFANPDMVGHTGDLAAATSAVEAVDTALGTIVDAVSDVGGALIVTADHGNCETMFDELGQPHTAHTTNPVPLYYLNAGDDAGLRDGGRICDVAPMMLEVLDLPIPEAMSGRSLRVVE